MSPGPLPRNDVLEELRSSRSREAWGEFLRLYGNVIFAACRSVISDDDDAADCFLFACEQLSRDSFRRLLRFRREGAASLETWLRVVVRNLSLDWHRKRFGRRRTFESIARLPHLEFEVYRYRYEQGFSLDDTFLCLQPNYPGLTIERLRDTDEKVEQSLSSRQMWLLSTRETRQQLAGPAVAAALSGDTESAPFDPPDPRPTPESLIAAEEERRRLRAALSKLPSEQQLLIKLRFGQALSFEQIAHLTGLGDAQRAHRSLTQALARVRTILEKKSGNG